MADLGRVTVYDSRIAEMCFPGGDVYRYTRKKTTEVKALAIIYAPKDTGVLAGSMRSSVTPVRGIGGWGSLGSVTCGAYYGEWVHDGTGIYAGNGYIYPIYGKYMRFFWKKLGRRVKAKRVAGQPAQPFLTDALYDVMGV